MVDLGNPLCVREAERIESGGGDALEDVLQLSRGWSPRLRWSWSSPWPSACARPVRSTSPRRSSARSATSLPTRSTSLSLTPKGKDRFSKSVPPPADSLAVARRLTRFRLLRTPFLLFFSSTTTTTTHTKKGLEGTAGGRGGGGRAGRGRVHVVHPSRVHEEGQGGQSLSLRSLHAHTTSAAAATADCTADCHPPRGVRVHRHLGGPLPRLHSQWQDLAVEEPTASLRLCRP